MRKLYPLGIVLSGIVLLSVVGSTQEQEQGTTTTLPATGDASANHVGSISPVSQVRIVRLSQIRGKVELARTASQGFNATFANLPVVEGARLQSQAGVAEVEFEDNSTLRIAPSSSIEFTELGRKSTGTTANKVRLVSGTLYVSLVNTKAVDFEVKVGDETIKLTPSTHVRLDVYPSGSQLVVFHGKAMVLASGAEILVSSGKVLKLRPAGVQTVSLETGGLETASLEPTSARNEEPGLYDNWDKQQKEQHDVRVGNSFAGAPYSYGLGDLNYYGSFASVGGCGQMWQPYFVSAAWDPYASGMWAYYPSAGYSWVSPYPWGWAPFHSGNWVNCPGAGWGWQPGQTWRGLQNVTTLSPVHRPIAPRPPLAGEHGLVPVNFAALHSSRLLAGDKFEFAKDSAGLGVPRDLGINLRKSSHAVLAGGVMQTRVQYADVLQQTTRSSVAPSGTNRAAEGRTSVMEHPLSRPVAIRNTEGANGPFSAAGHGGAGGSSSSSSRGTGSINSSGNSPSTSIGRASSSSTSGAPASSAGSHH